MTGQIEYWAKLGKLSEENPNLNHVFIKDILLAKEEVANDKLEDFVASKNYLPHKNKFCPLYNLKRYQEALETCDKAIALKPNRNDIYGVHTNRALALNKLERHKEAFESSTNAYF